MMTFPRTTNQTLAAAMHILARDIDSEDGVANAAIQEGAERIEELHALLARSQAALQALAPGSALLAELQVALR